MNPQGGDINLTASAATTSAYCQIADVETKGTLHGKAFTATTNPTLMEAIDRINYRAAEIDSRLASVGVTVPVDSTKSPRAFALLRELNALGAAGDAQQIAYFRMNPGKVESPKMLLAAYERQLKMYAGDGGLELAPDGGLKYPGNPALLLDAVFTVQKQVRRPKPWSRTRELYDFPDKSTIANNGPWNIDTKF